MKSKGYLAVSYACNENCKFCPCSSTLKTAGKNGDLSQYQDAVDQMKMQGISEITISGGEPTLFPELAKLIAYCQKSDFKVVLLSNGERFSNKSFLSDFVSEINIDELTIITTLHSHIPEEHEAVNQTNGSFARTISGLQNLIGKGANVILKHCITKANYQQLVDFYNYYNDLFPPTVTFQMCSIDYLTIATEDELLCFAEVKPYLEKMLDEYERRKTRRLYCINIPLCATDVYYWKYLKQNLNNSYQHYVNPYENKVDGVKSIVGHSNHICDSCKVQDICGGTYLSAYDIDSKKRIITPIL